MLINDKYALFNLKKTGTKIKGQEGCKLVVSQLAFNLSYFSNDGFDLLKCFISLNV